MLVHLNNRLIGILFVCSVLTGCVNLEAVGKFSEGAQALSEASGKFYTMELETDRQLAKMTVNLDSKGCKNKKNVSMVPWDCATKGENLMSEARRNRAAVAALAQYAKSLNEIATVNEDENIEKASQELAGNLGNLTKTLDANADTREQLLASAISELANIYVDAKARKVIYQNIKLAQGNVETIINMLRDDIKLQQERFNRNRENTQATREEWFKVFGEEYRSVGVSSSRKAFLTIAAGKLVEDELIDKLSEEPNKLFLKDLDIAAESLLKAHKAIQNPDLGDKAGEIVKFVNDAQALLSSVNQLSN